MAPAARRTSQGNAGAPTQPKPISLLPQPDWRLFCWAGQARRNRAFASDLVLTFRDNHCVQTLDLLPRSGRGRLHFSPSITLGQQRVGPFTQPARSVRSRPIDQQHVKLDLRFDWDKQELRGRADSLADSGHPGLLDRTRRGGHGDWRSPLVPDSHVARAAKAADESPGKQADDSAWPRVSPRDKNSNWRSTTR